MCDKSSTWREDERSRILYTCEEKYDGSMVAYVIDLESQLAKASMERDHLMKTVSRYAHCSDCKHDSLFIDEQPCHDCLFGKKVGKPGWEWRGMPDQKGSVQA